MLSSNVKPMIKQLSTIPPSTAPNTAHTYPAKLHEIFSAPVTSNRAFSDSSIPLVLVCNFYMSTGFLHSSIILIFLPTPMSFSPE